MRFQDEVDALRAKLPDLASIEALICDVNGILRGKLLPPEQLDRLAHSGVAIPMSTLLLDAMGSVPGTILAPVQDGDPDRMFFPVQDTLKPVPWAKRATCQLLLSGRGEAGAGLFCDPREALRRTVTRFSDAGLTPVVAVELEFYLLDPSSERARPVTSMRKGARLHGPQYMGLEPIEEFAPFLEDLDNICKAQSIPLTTTLCEYGDGQFEANLAHGPDPVKACDDAILLKRAAKAAARKYGLMASFMAKPWTGATGSGLHIHVSLLDKDGANIFAGQEGRERLGHAVGGVLDTLDASVALIAPNANSYRRFQPGLFVPTARNWGQNHRGVALRLPLAEGPDTRFEHRLAGADACPHLAMAAVLAGIHHGLTAKSSPTAMVAEGQPVPPAPEIPKRWPIALDLLERDTILADYLGNDFVSTYLRMKRSEEERRHSEVDERDHAWYLRVI